MNWLTNLLNIPEWKATWRVRREPEEPVLTPSPEPKRHLRCHFCEERIRRGDHYAVLVVKHLDCDNPRGGK